MSEGMNTFLTILSWVGISWLIIDIVLIFIGTWYLDTPAGKLKQFRATLDGTEITIKPVHKVAAIWAIIGIAFLIAF